MPSSPSELPERLRRAGRAPDPVFSPAEELYRRFSKQDLDGFGEFIDARLSFAISTNRQKFSQPEDVLYSSTNAYAGFGVVRVLVQDIPAPVEDDQRRSFWFRPCHLPEEDNYSHTHIQCEYEAPVGQEVTGSKSARKKCRSILKQKFVILKAATL